MIPKIDLEINDGIEFDFEIEEQPSLTWRLNPVSYRIEGFTDGLDAVIQSIYLIINVERYNWVIYSWNYGVELIELFGKDSRFVIPEVERRLTEAILQDDRVNRVYNFDFKVVKSKVTVSFTVDTIYGSHDFEFEEVLDVA